MKTIMVQMSDTHWTLEAMHLASAIARRMDGQIVLLRLVLANNPGSLGWGITPPDAKVNAQVSSYAAIAEDYGVAFCVQPMHFINEVDALVQAAQVLDVSIMFAHLPSHRVPFLRQFQLRHLKRQLVSCRLYTLDEEQPLTIDELMPAARPLSHSL